MPINFVKLDMVKDSFTLIISGRLFLATMGCRIDVKRGKLTFFDVEENHAEFGLFKNCESSSYTFSCCGCDMFNPD